MMAAGLQLGRDKLTLLFPERLQPLALWIEQLVAESTGKHGKGIVPITGERADAPLGGDRIVVSVSLGGDAPHAAQLERAGAAGVPIVEWDVADATSIGAEFLRWEIATATAGRVMAINPFDEPNVQQAKDATRALLDTYKSQHRLPLPESHASVAGARLTLTSAAEDRIGGAGAAAFLSLLHPPDYFAVLAYLPPDHPAFHAALEEFRSRVGIDRRCATMFGYGPRYLHSTGQLHKGGANNGVFVVITAEVSEDLPIPGEPFSFGVLEMAQAVGDFQSLDRTGRRALHVHLPKRDPELLRNVLAALSST
jgi:transaldolase/glucose-6-phosphate isomerase